MKGEIDLKKIINYEKDIEFKTTIGEICTISLEHDFTVDDRTLKGEFIIEGDYKPNSLSLNKEAFTYRLPLEYDLEDTCDIESLNYDIDNFEYNLNDNKLEVYIDFGVRYEEKTVTPTIPVITEEDLNKDFETIEPSDRLDSVDLDINLEETIEQNDIKPITTEIDTEFTIEEEKEEEEEIPNRLDDEEQELILDSTIDDEFITYHVHIVREGETLETIAMKYGTTIDIIKEYNSIEMLELKSKLIIPDCQNE